LDLVENLDRSRFECVVLSFTDGPMVDKMRALNIKTYVIHTERPFDFRKWAQVRRLLRKEKVDIVHAHGTRANSNVDYAARKENIPVVYTVHGWSFHRDQPTLVRKIRIWGERFLVSTSVLTICVSENNYSDAAGLFPLKYARVIKCGINL